MHTPVFGIAVRLETRQATIVNALINQCIELIDTGASEEIVVKLGPKLRGEIMEGAKLKQFVLNKGWARLGIKKIKK